MWIYLHTLIVMLLTFVITRSTSDGLVSDLYVTEPIISDNSAVHFTISLSKPGLPQRTFSYHPWKSISMMDFMSNLTNLSLLSSTKDSVLESAYSHYSIFILQISMPPINWTPSLSVHLQYGTLQRSMIPSMKGGDLSGKPSKLCLIKIIYRLKTSVMLGIIFFSLHKKTTTLVKSGKTLGILGSCTRSPRRYFITTLKLSILLIPPLKNLWISLQTSVIKLWKSSPWQYWATTAIK